MAKSAVQAKKKKARASSKKEFTDRASKKHPPYKPKFPSPKG